MKRFVILACLAVTLVQHKADDDHLGKQPQQDAQSAQSKATSVPSHPPANAREQQPAGDANKDQDQKLKVVALPKITTEKDRADWVIVVCTILLTSIGMVGTYIAVRTLCQIKRQADTLEDHKTKFDELAKAANSNTEAAILQVRAMQEQITEMSVQSGILQESVDVARDAAKAAQDSVELVISKERAKLFVEPQSFIEPGEGQLALAGSTYRVKLRGSTDATIVHSEVGLLMTDSEEIPVAPNMLMFGMPIPQLFTKEDSIADHYTRVEKIGTPSSLTPGDIQGLKDGTRFLHFWGLIKYEDFFGRPHTSKFRYLWKLSEFGFGRGQRSGYWRKRGPDEDNSDQ